MEKVRVQYSSSSKALPPQPIRIKTPGWGGSAEKMETGAQPQPWHCLPFVEASTYGLELLYQYDNPCEVINEGGHVRFEWDYASEPGGDVTGGEFLTFSPKDAPKHYLFNTRLDVVPPPGHVIRTEPHPRFFTDDTGTVPPALIGHLQNEWWPRKLFVVFKAPPPGQRHVFRKGEPYAQIVFVPQRVAYEVEPMPPEEDARRRELERRIDAARFQIADNVWHNLDGAPLSSHYKVLARAFARDGAAGVEDVVRRALERQRQTLPRDRPIPECLALGRRRLAEEKYDEARAVFTDVLDRDPANADAMSHLGICFACRGSPMAGLKLMTRAVELAPDSVVCHSNLGEMLRLMGRHKEAEASFRAAWRLSPDDPGLLSTLGLTLAQQGRIDEGLQACQAAVAMNPNLPVLHLRAGLALAEARRHPEARRAYEAALALDPQFAPARAALQSLPAESRT